MLSFGVEDGGEQGVLMLACVVEQCEGEPGGRKPGHPWTDTLRVLATLRRFPREGTPWRGLQVTEVEASGSTLRRALAQWADGVVLGQAHRLMVGLLRRLGTDLIVDSYSVRAKRGGELTGPSPTVPAAMRGIVGSERKGPSIILQ